MLTNDLLTEKTGLSIEEFIIKGATDFKFWVESLTEYKIMPFHLEWVKLFYDNKRTCILASRTIGKSTVLAQLYPLWMAFYERNKNFLIVSHNMPLSTKHIMNMRQLIDSIELLQQLRPMDRGQSWTKTEINTSTGCSIFCKPYSDNIRGYTVPHYCLIDEASYLLDLLIYERAILPMVQRHNANLCMVGTPRSEVDLLAKIQLPNSGFIVKKYPLEDEHGGLLWPKEFSRKRLDTAKKELGEIGYAREILLKLVSEESRSISSEAILKSLDTNLQLINQGTEGNEYYMGVDLAVSPVGDFSVYTIIEKTKGKNIIIRHIEKYRGMNPNSQTNLIANLYNRFKPRTGYIDISLVGPSIVTSLQTDFGISLKPFSFGPNKRNCSRNELFTNLISLFGTKDEYGHLKDNKIVIPRDVNHFQTITLTKFLIDQLAGLYLGKTKTNLDTYLTTTKHDDFLDSLSLACQAAIESRTGDIYIKSIKRQPINQFSRF